VFSYHIGRIATGTFDRRRFDQSLQEEYSKCLFDNVPLGDDVYGLLGITPGEMLHISGVGLLKYMFASLECLISLTQSKKRDQE
jgi:hypothetical protein